MSEAPEPTFLEKLRKARAKAAWADKERERVMADFWKTNPTGGSPTKEMYELGNILGQMRAEYCSLLVNNAEKIAALIEAATNQCAVPICAALKDETQPCDCGVAELEAALDALNEGGE